MVLCAIRSIVYVWYASQGRADMFFSNLRVNKWGGASLIASHRSTAVLPAEGTHAPTMQYTAVHRLQGVAAGTGGRQHGEHNTHAHFAYNRGQLIITIGCCRQHVLLVAVVSQPCMPAPCAFTKKKSIIPSAPLESVEVEGGWALLCGRHHHPAALSLSHTP